MILRNLKRYIGPCYFADNDGGDGGAGGGVDTGANANTDNDNAGMYNANMNTDNGGNDFNFDEFKNTYGKEYLDKPYMKAIDSPERLFKEMDNAQNLIGKKLNVPGPEATDKEQEEYLDLIRPKDKNVYQLSDAHLPENLKGFHPDGFEDRIKDLFQKAALTPKQATILSEGYDKIMLDFNGQAISHYAELQKAQQINDADYNALADKTWGTEREAVQNTARALLQEFTPEEFKKGLDDLSNENLVIMASVLKGISDKYISQDDLNILRHSGMNTQTVDTLKSEAQQKMAELMNLNPHDPKYEAKQREVNELYKRIGKLAGD